MVFSASAVDVPDVPSLTCQAYASGSDLVVLDDQLRRLQVIKHAERLTVVQCCASDAKVCRLYLTLAVCRLSDELPNRVLATHLYARARASRLQ